MAKRFGLQEVRVAFDLYEYEIITIFGPPDKVVDYVVARLGVSDWTEPKAERHRGMTYHRTGRPPIVWLPRKPRTPQEIGTLAHEMLHAVTMMLVGKGMQLTEASDEAFAYAIGYAVRRVLERAR